MFKSFSNMLNRKKRKDENIEDFNNYLDSIKREFVVLNKLIEAYNLDARKSLVPQIEGYLGRSLTADEKQTIEFASKSIRVGGYQKVEKPGSRGYHYHSKKKKKK